MFKDPGIKKKPHEYHQLINSEKHKKKKKKKILFALTQGSIKSNNESF